MPTIMRMVPTVAMEMPETVAVTANLRIAPRAMRKIDVPSPIGVIVPGPGAIHASKSLRVR